ncbi:hypothetical protein LSTR_LSTR017533 [Laodelphax striatellus]|uniref:Ig-like domain-containing protein n=1 Tax=Laodelphax striatellus TaxID=195883 RepID=A0A482X9G1_LAOST|nr:hypothetical protein LSTR_LSTR017533 [Laodelphax striatellus]
MAFYRPSEERVIDFNVRTSKSKVHNYYYSGCIIIIFFIAGSAVRGPVFVEEPPPWLDMSNSTGVILSCKAHGTPAPVIHGLDQADKEVTHLPRISTPGAPGGRWLNQQIRVSPLTQADD